MPTADSAAQAGRDFAELFDDNPNVEHALAVASPSFVLASKLIPRASVSEACAIARRLGPRSDFGLAFDLVKEMTSMNTFHDAKGRPWNLNLTAAVVRDIKKSHNVDLTSRDGVQRVVSEMELFVGVLQSLLGDQLKAANITAEDFDAAFDGSTWEAAGECLVTEVLLFGPNRRIAAKVLPAARERQDKKADEIIEKIKAGEIDPQK